MRQRSTFRGFGFVLLMIILISMAAMLPRQGFADRISNQEFMTMLTQDKDQIDQVTIRQNSQAPTGEVVLELTDGSQKHLYEPQCGRRRGKFQNDELRQKPRQNEP